MGDSRTRLTLHRSYLRFTDLLFPPHCVRCHRVGAHWCDDCRQGVAAIPGQVCPSCGLPDPKSKLCEHCQAHPPTFDTARACYRYSARLRPIMVALKYRPNAGLAWLLAEALAHRLDTLDWAPDLIVPVPLAADRVAERGFNQAELVARPLSWLTEIAFDAGSLARVRATPKQVGRTLAARQMNMQGAFRANHEVVAGKRVLVVDDVMTTGATLNAAARALKGAGASRVLALTVGRATL